MPDQPVTLTDQERDELDLRAMRDYVLSDAPDADLDTVLANCQRFVREAAERMLVEHRAAAFERGRQAQEATIREVVEETCPHPADEHAEGSCEVCDFAFALAEDLIERLSAPPVPVDAHTSSEQEAADARTLRAAADAWDESRPASVRPTAVAEWLRRRAVQATSSEQEALRRERQAAFDHEAERRAEVKCSVPPTKACHQHNRRAVHHTSSEQEDDRG